jgi:NAD-dependent dihydropyrimidine dehydrogenase PreA subunit
MEWKYIKNGDTLSLNQDKCTGCGMCVEVCPHSVFGIKEKKAFIRDYELCMECGACMKNCPFKAIEVAAGVGCAAFVIGSLFNGKDASCGCGDGKEKGGVCC